MSLRRRAIRTSIAVGEIPWEFSSSAREGDTIAQVPWAVNGTLCNRVRESRADGRLFRDRFSRFGGHSPAFGSAGRGGRISETAIQPTG